MKGLIKTALNFTSKNSTQLLTATSIIGLAASVALSIKATPKAMRIMEETQPETPLDVVKATWKCYIPTVAVGGLTIASMVWSQSINLKRTATLATAYTLSESKFKDYRKKLTEKMGKTKARDIEDEVAQDKVRKPINKKDIIHTGKGSTLCYDPYSDRYFYSDVDTIRRILDGLGKDMVTDDFVSINEVYDALGLANVKLGDDMGWHIDDGFIDPSFSAVLSPDDEPCIVLDFYLEPKHLNNRR